MGQRRWRGQKPPKPRREALKNFVPWQLWPTSSCTGARSSSSSGEGSLRPHCKAGIPASFCCTCSLSLLRSPSFLGFCLYLCLVDALGCSSKSTVSDSLFPLNPLVGVVPVSPLTSEDLGARQCFAVPRPQLKGRVHGRSSVASGCLSKGVVAATGAEARGSLLPRSHVHFLEPASL